MGNEWGPQMPRWVREGRTGPGSAAPRYATCKRRAQVRRDWNKANGGGCAVVVLALPAVASVVVWVGRQLGG